MALRGPIQIPQERVFPAGVFALGTVVPARDYDHSTKEAPVQARDRDTGLPVWLVEAMDGDPQAFDHVVRVRVASVTEPVLPTPREGDPPLVAVVFDDLAVVPYVNTNGNGRPRLGWSYRASGVRPLQPADPRSAAKAA